MERIVIVGGGMAGLEAAAALRAEGHAGAIPLLGAEPHLPYDRPPLSKELLLGKVETSELEAEWDELDADVRLACAATALRDGVVTTDQGEIGFDGLVIATGTSPVR